jgi:ATP-binding cassette subfamily F protein 3
MPDQPEAKVRARAAAIGFTGAMADTPASQLSGGERTRLLLGLATLAGPHLILLDEPTNHLDIDSRAALIAAINSHPGAVILVSHDRHLIDACADRLWLVADGQVVQFEGDVEEYSAIVLADRSGSSRTSQRPKTAAKGRVDVRRAAAERRTELAPLRRRVAEAEAAIKRHGDDLANLDQALAEPGLFGRNPAQAAALSKARAQAASALGRAEDDWLEASAAYENAIVD